MMLIGLATQWVVAAAAFIAAVGLALAWLKTGRKALLWGVAAALVAGVATIVVESLVVTDTERIEAEIFNVADDVARNDIDAVLDHLHPDAEELQQEVKYRLAEVDFSGVLINVRRVEIQGQQSPRTASVQFIATPSGTHKSSQQTIPRNAKLFLQVELVEQGEGRWLIRSYELREFIEAFQKPRQR